MPRVLDRRTVKTESRLRPSAGRHFLNNRFEDFGTPAPERSRRFDKVAANQPGGQPGNPKRMTGSPYRLLHAAKGLISAASGRMESSHAAALGYRPSRKEMI